MIIFTLENISVSSCWDNIFMFLRGSMYSEQRRFMSVTYILSVSTNSLYAMTRSFLGFSMLLSVFVVIVEASFKGLVKRFSSWRVFPNVCSFTSECRFDCCLISLSFWGARPDFDNSGLSDSSSASKNVEISTSCAIYPLTSTCLRLPNGLMDAVCGLALHLQRVQAEQRAVRLLAVRRCGERRVDTGRVARQMRRHKAEGGTGCAR
mmetsp:Transcript_47146/g.118756  ORF Transcript_47146/g.118756 Transcript_47146/m.118756 type:complete len:207 (+) Transcript_47146:1724-2344(+)